MLTVSVSVLVNALVIVGVMVMVSVSALVNSLVIVAMIDTPWWERTNSISEATLGWMFFIHGLSTLALIAVTAMHIYFGLRPDKLFYTRSMIKGWISEEELAANHDRDRWAPDEPASPGTATTTE